MPIYETEATRKNKKNTNASLSFFRNNKHYVHTLWVTLITQPHQVSGSKVAVDAHVAHWYPKSYQPGDLSVTIRCRTQADYQRLANHGSTTSQDNDGDSRFTFQW
jgi:hypothetical protein